MYVSLYLISIALYLIGMFVLFMPSQKRVLAHQIGSTTAGLASFLMAVLSFSFIVNNGSSLTLFEIPNSFITFVIDKLSAYFLLIVGTIGTITSIYGYNYALSYKNDKLKILTSEYNMFLVAMCLVVTAYNALAFLLAWEFMAISSFLLVNHQQYKRTTWQAAYQYILMTNLGTALIAAAFFLLAPADGNLDYLQFMQNSLTFEQNNLVFFLAFFGLAIKAGLVPMHVWLPRAHPIAPTHISALMSAVMLKLAVYTFLRFIMHFITVTPAVSWGVIVLLIGLISAFVGSLYLQIETDIKKILAYSSIEHLGIIFAAIGTGLIFLSHNQAYWANICFLAALIHSLNHAFMKTTMFLVAGCMIHTVHTRNIEHMGALLRFMPYTAAFALIGSMSIVALPYTAGFLGEWLLLLSFLQLPTFLDAYGYTIAVVALILFGLTGALALGGFVRFFSVAFLGKCRSEIRRQTLVEVTGGMLWATGIAASLCLLSGFFAGYLARFAAIVLPNRTLSDLSGVKLGSNTFMPLTLALLTVGIVFLLYKSLDLKNASITRQVWSCGIHPTSRMQYSATGFSKPIRRVFAFFLKPERELHYAPVTYSNTQPRKIIFKAYIHDLTSERLYLPFQGFLVKIAGILRRIQAGGIQVYISYILIALVAVLLYGAR